MEFMLWREFVYCNFMYQCCVKQELSWRLTCRLGGLQHFILITSLKLNQNISFSLQKICHKVKFTLVRDFIAMHLLIFVAISLKIDKLQFPACWGVCHNVEMFWKLLGAMLHFDISTRTCIKNSSGTVIHLPMLDVRQNCIISDPDSQKWVANGGLSKQCWI